MTHLGSRSNRLGRRGVRGAARRGIAAALSAGAALWAASALAQSAPPPDFDGAPPPSLDTPAPPVEAPPRVSPESDPDGPAPAPDGPGAVAAEEDETDRADADSADAERADTAADETPEAARKSREERLAEAFERLKSDEAATRAAGEQTIARLWARSGSASADLLLERARKAIEKERWDAALTHLDDLANLYPEFAEGWNARATAHFKQEDLGRALEDVARTLALEPRHFGAWAGLGLILEQLDEPKKALAAYQRALEIHPHLDGPTEGVKRLQPKIDGRES